MPSQESIIPAITQLGLTSSNTISMIPNLKFMTLKLFLPSPNGLLLNLCYNTINYRWWY